MKIPMAQSEGWFRYYASSPNYNLLVTPHPDFEQIIIREPNDYVIAREKAQAAGCIVVDEICQPHFIDLQNVAIFGIGDDLHSWDQKRFDLTYNFSKRCNLVFSDYMLTQPHPMTFGAQPRSERGNYVFCPNHAQGTTAPKWREWGERKGAVVPGTINPRIYPFRTQCSEIPGVEKQLISSIPGASEQWRYHEGFVDWISHYKIGITCNAVLGYTVAKYFEIPLAGALLFAADIENSFEKMMYGFDSSNSILLPRSQWFNADNHLTSWQQLGSEDRTQGIAQAGQRLIMHRHTAVQRLNLISSVIKAYMAGDYQNYDQWQHFVDSWGPAQTYWGNA